MGALTPLRAALVFAASIFLSGVSWADVTQDPPYLEAEKGKGLTPAADDAAIIEEDPQKIEQWFLQAVGENSAEAQYSLGKWYYSRTTNTRQGRVKLSKDYSLAEEWYRKAADQGFYQAQYDLGLLYAGGRLGKENHAEAYFWFIQAAKSDNVILAAAAATERDKAALSISSDLLVQTQKRADEWKSLVRETSK